MIQIRTRGLARRVAFCSRGACKYFCRHDEHEEYDGDVAYLMELPVVGSAMASVFFRFLDDDVDGLPSALLFLPSLVLAPLLSTAALGGVGWALWVLHVEPSLMVVQAPGVT